MIRVEMTGAFDCAYRALVAHNLPLRHRIYQQIVLFRNNPQDLRIRNHPLKRRMKGKWAFSITDDIRVIYCFRGKNTVRLLAIGTHEEVYRKKNPR
jgi:mRNA-degrading endonuclease YafQ of YafQ-DinJ toxin-antitoxin module